MSEDTNYKKSPFDVFFRFIETKKPGDKFIFLAALITFISAAIALILLFNATTLSSSPAQGGVYREGVLGTARFINPALAITRTDQDLTSLVYSGLMRIGENGSLENDLAESVTISDDGLVYNVILKPGLRFHDGTPLTTADIEYTISLLQNAELKSPFAGHWNGVGVEVISPSELNFVLTEAYAPFIENLTIGIMSKQLWGQLAIEELPFGINNTEAVGSGPYEIAEIIRDNRGGIAAIELIASRGNGYTPNIDRIIFKFYEDSEALFADLKAGALDASASLTTEQFTALREDDSFTLQSYPLPRVFGLFLNQNRSIALRDRAVREAISTAIDRNNLIESIFGGQATAEYSPLPSAFFEQSAPDYAELSAEDRVSRAQQILVDNGWTQNESSVWTKTIDGDEVDLRFTISTINNELFAEIARVTKEQLARIGIPVEISQYEQADFLQSVVRTRDYAVLLTGTDVGRGLDLYQFWHSSQRENQLNTALYTNLDADVYLTRYREAVDEETKNEQFTGFLTEVNKDLPAIFLASPAVTYAVVSDVSVIPVKKIGRASDRFSTVTAWYTATEKLWPFVE